MSNAVKKSIKQREQAVSGQSLYYVGPKKRISIQTTLIIVLVTLILASIYVVPAFVSLPAPATYASVAVPGNEAAKEVALTYQKNHPEEDFDGDGLINDAEIQNSTAAYRIDTDYDGTTDFAELNITNTNPSSYDDAILSYIAKEESSEPITLPFEANGIIMWADTWSACARGSAVEAGPNEYRFCYFTGWAKFPQDGYAYEINEKGHVPLKRNAQNGAYYIHATDSDEMLVYYSTQELQPCYIFSFCLRDYVLHENIGAKLLNFILPGYGTGWITCRKATMLDVDCPPEDIYYNSPVVLSGEETLDESRFDANQIRLEDLQGMIFALQNGDNVLLSLLSPDNGEAVVEAYGYTSSYDLFVCDPHTGDELGALTIEPYSLRLLDQSGEIAVYNFYRWDGCGYSSQLLNKISVIGTVSSADDIGVNDAPDAENIVIIEPEEVVSEKQLAEMRRESIINNDSLGTILAQYGPNAGRWQTNYGSVSQEDVEDFVTATITDLEFDAYFEKGEIESKKGEDVEDPTVESYIIVANENCDLVKFVYDGNVLAVRYEEFSGEQTTVMTQEYFKLESAAKAYSAAHPASAEETDQETDADKQA